MRVVSLVCAYLSVCGFSNAQNFFDYSDEGSMLKRFKDFESRKISSIRTLEYYGVLEKKVNQENLKQAIQLARGLWGSILQESLPHKVDFAASDEILLDKQFWQFRTHHQSSLSINGDVKRYLMLFSRIEGMVY